MSDWIDYKMLKAEINLHRNNAQRIIKSYKEQGKSFPNSNSSRKDTKKEGRGSIWLHTAVNVHSSSTKTHTAMEYATLAVLKRIAQTYAHMIGVTN